MKSVTIYAEAEFELEEEQVIEFLRDCKRGEVIEILKESGHAELVGKLDDENGGNLYDEYVVRHFAEAKKKYTLKQIEELLPV